MDFIIAIAMYECNFINQLILLNFPINIHPLSFYNYIWLSVF